MRLYIIENTPLAELLKISEPPRKGDVVAYFRDLQDIDGTTATSLQEKGIECVWAEGLISHEMSDEIDAVHDRYIQNWHHHDSRDTASAEDELFPYLLGYLYPSFYNTGMIFRLGEIIRCLFEAYPDTDEVLTDLEDGKSYYRNIPGKKDRLLRRTVLMRMAGDTGFTCRQIRPSSAIPTYRVIQNNSRLLPMLWRWIGGFRWQYLFSRLTLGMTRQATETRRVFLFLNHGLFHIGKALMKTQDIEVRCDRVGYPPMRPLRGDHFLAIPRPRLLQRAWQLYRRTAKGWTDQFIDDFCTFHGVDYSPFLQHTRQEMLKEMLIPAVIVFEQTRKMLMSFKPDCVILNGEGNFPARSAIALARNNAFKTIFIRHGLNTYNRHFYPTGHNNPHVIYAVHGTDHLVEYGTHLAENEKPRRILAGNPALTEMNGLRERYKRSAKGRVLGLNFTGSESLTVSRVRSYDPYTIRLFAAARELIEQGMSFSYRPHHDDNIDYINYALDQMGLAEKVEIEKSPTFQEAILHHDVVVLNVTSCHYQSLYAGWPTIFFEPDFVRQQFIGLPAAVDIDYPLAQTSKELVSMVTQALDPTSAIAKFPHEFATTHAPRFLGPDPQHSDQQLSDFIIKELEE